MYRGMPSEAGEKALMAPLQYQFNKNDEYFIPPYSLKNQVLARLYAIGKPFAMLINFQGIFDSRERFRLFKEHRVEMLWLSPRVNYVGADGKRGGKWLR